MILPWLQPALFRLCDRGASPKSRFHFIQQFFQSRQLFFGQGYPLAHGLTIQRPLADVIFRLLIQAAPSKQPA
jgi:hypothetical protein